MVVKIQVLTSDDWPLWRELRLAALTEAPYAFASRLEDWQGSGDREERWRGRLAIPRSQNIVAFLDEEPVGMASGVPTDDAGVAELISMWVRPTARGRGVGESLIASVRDWAKRLGAECLRLQVHEANSFASSLYHRCGFRGNSETSGAQQDGGKREKTMTLPLNNASSARGGRAQ